jgi:hypothetical protein
MVLEDPFFWPPMERRREFAAANLQAESYLEREHKGAMGCAWRRARHNEDTPKSWIKVRYRIGHIRPFGKSMLQMSICKD